ncbi:hemerythrin domain-containing protein [Streptomyces europaeiscabiei]|uniref:Hemerythrin domain-containing protein n=1 Tax=Streptomyces europaeiscabiei TaxID=146819 RepID=A0ABU4NWV5_9ACTN|nr:hemerythrin domain-containing protein [Streptomyces europaeiscabiei]MDX2758020.1 hemerythrin domain-containing protein [Streptomyces europaeiscabiei]MDX3548567.1 hemerythrin domain-containing protein [Streptomyces europaeiscabiei]MDX3558211.1 hemerythrin domain-containing protein [Streptomyces europaeiscabiei]MDX3706040.1 hemerythrin domain-containing protein [Streptomyces europaeiscabiei]MDX3710262.1 hemerythrin domain-containing protein [Streptomyces europaeiscabiei]
MHHRLREALSVTRASLADGTPGNAATRELLLYCHGFCTALDGHHQGEDRTLFPAVAAAHPELRPVLRSLEDHSRRYYPRPDVAYVPLHDAQPIERGPVWLEGNTTERVRDFVRAAADVAELGGDGAQAGRAAAGAGAGADQDVGCGVDVDRRRSPVRRY